MFSETARPDAFAHDAERMTTWREERSAMMETELKRASFGTGSDLPGNHAGYWD